ncbi:MAG: ATP synthase F1 subunit delta [Acidobacteriaceae bacterium]|nr:ATP synthase F1 subunit delta [Acidobacteriaceae bacterium]
MAIVDLRYARALAQVVSEQKLDVLAVEKQLRDFAALLVGSPDLREVLANPSIPEKQKLGVLDALAPRLGLEKAARNFIALVAHHDRLHELDEMLEAYHAIADQELRVAEVEVTSALPLDEASRQLIEQKIAALTGGERVRATYREDKSLLGGAIVKVGSTIYDGSVRAQLEQLKLRLMNAA